MGHVSLPGRALRCNLPPPRLAALPDNESSISKHSANGTLICAAAVITRVLVFPGVNHHQNQFSRIKTIVLNPAA